MKLPKFIPALFGFLARLKPSTTPAPDPSAGPVPTPDPSPAPAPEDSILAKLIAKLSGKKTFAAGLALIVLGGVHAYGGDVFGGLQTIGLGAAIIFQRLATAKAAETLELTAILQLPEGLDHTPTLEQVAAKVDTIHEQVTSDAKEREEAKAARARLNEAMSRAYRPASTLAPLAFAESPSAIPDHT